MKHINRYALTLTSAALMCGAVAAQERTTGTQQPSSQKRELEAGDVHASNLIGAAVKDPAGATIGSISDLIVSSGADVRLAVISVGGVLGLGDKKVALPYGQFSVAPDGKTVYVEATRQELEARPAFGANANDAQASAERAGARAAPEPNARPAARSADRSPAAQPRVEAPTARNGAAARTLKASEQPASSLIGAAVVDGQDARVGKIHDLIVAPGRGGSQAVLSLPDRGFASRMVSVPLDELTIERDATDNRRREPDRVRTDLTVAQLEALPDFHY